MANQGLPICSGGPDANLKIGNVFMLWTVDVDRDEREAACAAARAWFEYPAREAAGKAAAAGKRKKGKGMKGGLEVCAPDALRTSPDELPAAVVLMPEIQNDTWERERSQAALYLWCSMTKRMGLASLWRSRMAALGAKEFKDPDKVLAQMSGRAAVEERDAAIKSEIKRQRDEDLPVQEEIENPADPEPEEGGVQFADQYSEGKPLIDTAEETDPRKAVQFSPEERKALGLDKEFGA